MFRDKNMSQFINAKKKINTSQINANNYFQLKLKVTWLDKVIVMFGSDEGDVNFLLFSLLL